MAKGNNKLYINGNDSSFQNLSLSVINSGYTTHSPLILDTNHNGKISATAGEGVNLGNGVSGAATGGDSMLAMKLNSKGNSPIDGTEVFGDETVNPFTGQACNAQNGFEALQDIAESAQQATGIQIINHGEVNVQKLNQALQSSGLGSLGLISGNNTSTLQGLGDVAEINTSYTNGSYNSNSSVQDRQDGSYISTNGKKYACDDVWFLRV